MNIILLCIYTIKEWDRVDEEGSQRAHWFIRYCPEEYGYIYNQSGEIEAEMELKWSPFGKYHVFVVSEGGVVPI